MAPGLGAFPVERRRGTALGLGLPMTLAGLPPVSPDGTRSPSLTTRGLSPRMPATAHSTRPSTGAATHRQHHSLFPSPRTAREAVRPTTSPFVVKGMLPTRPSTVQARNFASDDTMSGVNDARTPYWPPQIPATHPSEMYNIDSSRELLDKLRVRQTQQLALSGRGCQSDLQERWQEMHAWCGYLATNLEGACCRIEQLGDERRDLLSRQDEMGNAVRQLEYRASNKNVARLEQTIQQLQQDLLDRDASIQQLTADLKEGASVEMPAETRHLVSRVLEETLLTRTLLARRSAGVGVREQHFSTQRQ